MKNKIIIFIAIALIPAFVQAATVSLPNPLSVDSVPEFISNMIRGLLGVVGAIALFFLILGGFQWMTSQGNADKIQKGKDSMVWSIFGLVMVFVSYILINLVFQILGGGT
ncbi:MAG: hypothetical protein COV55_03715 [Candidatus Komeilibacteria bacterium CG11_big_fil_rev_8_21_14_0_20_36_20]|uniref:Conjugal transfer protein TrbC n=1 Tax=Candidatus Komeilibacteria bacterium CG11_big_fil_rev_8_21_14_0_20_36_20 TaxID=1974477 RepID=A0A2H0NCL3_9BACT|nr:MAG: hypothetical protein COV55_03715 [Candidatus Komeilibacteria bacterium CG11_big_fil_rev_8_21_14_0_20_36_20]PIR81937.1 MAG: hypothetical protein COU21_01160 [Candidatus Komeilibacteria bacterium CG10_big_fil_rev_8_21_14_0_10_36_65]PJC55469.1 MAG: hypothetical protein CO027_01840 [Candidatus Komeilibacteria bacterium CG_4_9_14_0_2_um_filter_36_13]